MRRTRFSLYYLAGYLCVAGLMLLLVPTFALQLLLSNGDYGGSARTANPTRKREAPAFCPSG